MTHIQITETSLTKYYLLLPVICLFNSILFILSSYPFHFLKCWMRDIKLIVLLPALHKGRAAAMCGSGTRAELAAEEDINCRGPQGNHLTLALLSQPY